MDLFAIANKFFSDMFLFTPQFVYFLLLQKKSEKKSKKEKDDAEEKEKDVDQKDEKETKSSDEKTKEDSTAVTEVCAVF